MNAGCRLQGSNIEVFCLHPGIIPTALSRHLIPWPLNYILKLVLYFLGKTVEEVRHTTFCFCYCTPILCAEDSGELYLMHTLSRQQSIITQRCVLRLSVHDMSE